MTARLYHLTRYVFHANIIAVIIVLGYLGVESGAWITTIGAFIVTITLVSLTMLLANKPGSGYDEEHLSGNELARYIDYRNEKIDTLFSLSLSAYRLRKAEAVFLPLECEYEVLPLEYEYKPPDKSTQDLIDAYTVAKQNYEHNKLWYERTVAITAEHLVQGVQPERGY